MKIEYEEETSQHGPFYYLIPEGSRGDEMRFLTTLADLGQRPDIRIRVVGSKRTKKTIPGMPANPVIKLKIVLEKLDGSAPRAAELLRHERAAILDPSKPVKRQVSAHVSAVQNARNRNMRVTEDGDHFVIEE